MRELEIFLFAYIALFISFSFFFLNSLPELYLFNYVLFFIILSVTLFRIRKDINNESLTWLLILTILLTVTSIFRSFIDVFEITGTFVRNFITAPLTLFIFLTLFALIRSLKR